jgi:hypothetical protein
MQVTLSINTGVIIDDHYWINMENSLEMMELFSINKESLD